MPMQTGTAPDEPPEKPDVRTTEIDRIVLAGTTAYGDLTPASALLRATVGRRVGGRIGRRIADHRPSTARHDHDDSDLYLIAACEEGSASAWDALWTHHLRPLATIAARAGLCSRDAQEVVVELLSELWMDTHRSEDAAGLVRFDGIGSLNAWLRTIVHRRAIRWLRRRDRWSMRLEFDQTPSPEPSEQVAEREERCWALSEICKRRSRLSHREAAVVALKYDGGLSQSAIARRLRIGEPRVSRLHHRALAKLTPCVSIAI